MQERVPRFACLSEQDTPKLRIVVLCRDFLQQRVAGVSGAAPYSGTLSVGLQFAAGALTIRRSLQPPFLTQVVNCMQKRDGRDHQRCAESGQSNLDVVKVPWYAHLSSFKSGMPRRKRKTCGMAAGKTTRPVTRFGGELWTSYLRIVTTTSRLTSIPTRGCAEAHKSERHG